MRLFELEQPAVGDILEIELGDAIVEAVITAIEGDEIIAETDNRQGATVLAESYGRYYCSTDKRWKERKGPKQTRKTHEGLEDPKDNPCWDGYHPVGTKKKNGKTVPNCVPEAANPAQQAAIAIAKKKKEGVAEGLDAEAYKEKLLATLPQMMRFYEKNVKGWKPSEEQMLAAVETGYTVMKHTGDVKQAGKAMMDELNTLHRMSQGQQGVAEAEYQGREVKLGKPMQGDVKKFKVYVKDPKTGNVKKVNFGDPNMRIKKSNPKRRKSFRARHNCANPGPRTKARYWSCRKW